MEYFDIIDENGRELGYTKERTFVHQEGDWHKGVHVWIVKGDKLLLQKRSPVKDSFPNCFDVSCGGHVTAGDNYETTAIRELTEELGIQASAKDLAFIEERKHITDDPPRKFVNREILRVYLLKLKFDLNELILQKEEVSEVRLFSMAELRVLLRKTPDLFTPSVSPRIINLLENTMTKD
jgi:8-oxo-dGTP diphosphatase